MVFEDGAEVVEVHGGNFVEELRACLDLFENPSESIRRLVLREMVGMAWKTNGKSEYGWGMSGSLCGMVGAERSRLGDVFAEVEQAENNLS